MGIRQKLNDVPKVGIAAIVLLVVGVYAVVAWEVRHPKFGSHSSISSYYSIDDGKTYFIDDGARMPPFDHDGSPAVRCYVYQCKSGMFVGYLEKYTDELLKNLNTPFDPKNRGPGGPVDFRDGTLVKKSGDKDWVKKYSARGQAIQKVQCPDGSGDPPKLVNP